MAPINHEAVVTTVKKLGLPTTIALLAVAGNVWLVNQIFKDTEKANETHTAALLKLAEAIDKLDDDLRDQGNRIDFMVEKMRDVQDSANTAILLSRAMRRDMTNTGVAAAAPVPSAQPPAPARETPARRVITGP